MEIDGGIALIESFTTGACQRLYSRTDSTVGLILGESGAPVCSSTGGCCCQVLISSSVPRAVAHTEAGGSEEKTSSTIVV